MHALLALAACRGVMGLAVEGRAVKTDDLAGRLIVDGDLPVLAFCMAGVACGRASRSNPAPRARLGRVIVTMQSPESGARHRTTRKARASSASAVSLAYRIDDLSLEPRRRPPSLKLIGRPRHPRGSETQLVISQRFHHTQGPRPCSLMPCALCSWSALKPCLC